MAEMTEMTEPLYYTDGMMRECTARVKAVQTAAEGFALLLDRTCFYPEGGGQPGDRGRIVGHTVVDTIPGEDGSILHKLGDSKPPALRPGEEVECALDWDHRYEYMQQHTGQHILSGALHRVASADTVSVHQGTEVVTIEIALDTITDRQLLQVEEEANGIIAADLPVRAFLVDDQELSRYTLRRPTSRRGTIRLVEIEEYDLVACGGIHLPRTGLINVVKAVGSESIRGRLRLAFKIGDRAIRDYQLKHQAITEGAELFSCRPVQVPDRIRAAQAEIQDLHRAMRLRAERLAATLLREQPDKEEPESLLLEEEDEDLFKALIERASRSPLRRMVLLNRTRESVQWALIVGAGHAFPGDKIREHVLLPVGARGGGKPPLWRGIIPRSRDDGQDKAIDTFIESFRILWEEGSPTG